MNPPSQRQSGQSQFKTILLVAVFFLAGIALSALYFRGKVPASPSSTESSSPLSPSTAKVLQQLGTPLEIRYYSLLDTANVSSSVQAFASRVDKMLDRYQQESDGKIKITRYTATNSTAQAAAQEGLSAFNLDKGDASYLGMSILRNGKKEVIPYLASEYEQAVESDLTRAIARSSSSGVATPIASAITPAVSDSVKHVIPNLDNVTLEQGTQLLREAAVADFKQTAQDTQAQLDVAETQVLEAQNDDEKQRALDALNKLKADQTQKLKDIAAKTQAQIASLKQSKEAR